MSGSWCQTKIAYLLDPNAWLSDQNGMDLFDHFHKDRLPDGIEMRETDISGAAGFGVVFEKDELFTEHDIASLENLIDRLNKTSGKLNEHYTKEHFT